MATGKLKRTTKKLEIRNISIPYNCPANGQFNKSLKTLIDAKLASGERFIGIAGFTTNDTSIVPISIYYGTSSYSLQLANYKSSAISNTVSVFYVVETA